MSEIHNKTHNRLNWWIPTIGIVMILSVILLFVCTSIKHNVPNDITPPELQNGLDKGALLNKDGWNVSALRALNTSINNFDDNEALGNANGANVANVITLGGIEWLVTFRQDNIITILATSSVGLANNVNEANEFLVQEFYPQLLNNIGYAGFADYVVSAGDNTIIYQQSNLQNVPLLADNGRIVTNNDVIFGQKIWLPSAYEMGGNVTNILGTNAINPGNRVNSFQELDVNDKLINTGLWNISSANRSTTDGMWLRSSTGMGESAYLDNAGVLNVTSQNQSKNIVPAMHLALPVVDAMGNIIKTTPSGDINNTIKLAFNNTTGMSGAGTSASPYQVKKPQDLVGISKQVLAGNDCSNLYFEMQNDIDMSDITLWSPIGKFVATGNTNNKAFAGIFDGNGYVIRNLSEFTTGLPGVFGYISGNAEVKALGVEDSNWTTSVNNAGGIVGYMDGNSSVIQCYNACGISGGNYVGGLVGTSTSTKAIQDCYNIAGVAGQNYVGGIAGKATKIVNVYNIGSTMAKSGTSVGGIAGQVDSVQNSFYSNSTNNGKGTYKENFANMSGINTTLYLNAGWDFTTIWKITRTINNQFPILRQFVHDAEIRLVTNIEDAGTYKIIKDSTEYTDVEQLAEGISFALNTYLSISATANSTYRFVGWYHYYVGLDGQPVFTEEFLSNVTPFSLGAVVDNYFLEARFIKIYNVVIEDKYTGFDDFSEEAYTVDVLNNNATATNTYDEGSTITITVNTTLINLDYDGLKYKLAQNGTYSASEITTAWVPKAVTQDSVVYTININEENGVFASGNALYVQLQFTRLINLSIALSVTEPVDKYLPTATAKWGSTTISATSNGVCASEKIRYDTNFTISQTMPSESRVFVNWTVDIEGTLKVLTTSADSTIIDFDASNFVGIFNFADDDYNIIVIANYTMKMYTMTVNNVFGVTKDANDANNENALATIAIVLDGETVELKDTQISGVVTKSIEYGRHVVIAFLPKYHNGYKLSNVYSGSKTSTTKYTYAEPSATKNYYSFEVASFSGTTEFTIKYDYLPVSFDVIATGVDGVELPDDCYTASGALTNVNYYTKISTTSGVGGVQITLDESVKKNYGFSELLVNFGEDDYAITCNLTPSNYNQVKYVLFTNVYKVQDIYSSADVLLSPDTKVFTMKVVLQAMARNLTIVNYYEGTTLAVSEADASIWATANSDVTILQGSQYVDGAEVTVTAEALNIGHQLMGFKTSTTETSYKGTVNNAGTYNNDGTYKFTIQDNTTVIAYYKKRTYNVNLNSNIPQLHTGLTNYPMADQGIEAYVANTKVTLTGTTTQNIPGTYGDNISMNFLFTKDFAVGEGLTIRLHKIELYYDDDILPYEVYNKSFETYMFTLDQDVSVVKVDFVYRLIQEVTITLDSTETSTTLANGTLLKLRNESTGEATFVVLNRTLNGVTVDIPTGKYVIEFYLPIFCRALLTLGNTSTSLGTAFDIQIVNASTHIEVDKVERDLLEDVTNSFIIL